MEFYNGDCSELRKLASKRSLDPVVTPNSIRKKVKCNNNSGIPLSVNGETEERPKRAKVSVIKDYCKTGVPVCDMDHLRNIILSCLLEPSTAGISLPLSIRISDRSSIKLVVCCSIDGLQYSHFASLHKERKLWAPELDVALDEGIRLKIRRHIRIPVLQHLLFAPIGSSLLKKLKKNKVENMTTEASSGDDIEYTRCGKLDLLLSKDQLSEWDYPNVQDPRYADFVNIPHNHVSEESPMYSIDCEMCMTSARELEVTRVTVVDENLKSVYETKVKPDNPIVDYLTQYSGIREEDLVDVTTRLEDVQRHLIQLLPGNCILVGQSLHEDLLRLKMAYPRVIDTAVLFSINAGVRIKLKTLAAMLLDKCIQSNGEDGHDSFEDAATCMELVKLKLARGLDHKLGRKSSLYEDIWSRLDRCGSKKGAIVDSGKIVRRLGKSPVNSIMTSTDFETLRKIGNMSLKNLNFIVAGLHSLGGVTSMGDTVSTNEIIKFYFESLNVLFTKLCGDSVFVLIVDHHDPDDGMVPFSMVYITGT